MMSKFSIGDKVTAKYVTACIAVVLLTTFLCYRYLETFHSSKTAPQQKTKEKLNKMREGIVGKRLHSFGEIAELPTFKSKILFLYTGYDCQECIKESFNFLREINSNSEHEIYVFASDSNIGSDKIHYDYDKMIYFDAESAIRKEMNYILTPVFLFLDCENTVKSVFWPLPGDQERNKEGFSNLLNNR